MSKPVYPLISENENHLNTISNKVLRAFYQEKSLALSEIILIDDIDNDEPYCYTEKYSKENKYNSNVIIISSVSINDGNTQLINNSSYLCSTYLE
jgi:hypothetical protein